MPGTGKTPHLSTLGEDIVLQINDLANPLQTQIDTFKQTELENVFSTLSTLIYKLNRIGILTVQRTCYGCTFYQDNEGVAYCNLLEKELFNQDIRLDCPEYNEKTTT